MIDDVLRPPRRPSEWAADAVRALGAVSIVAAVIGWSWVDAGILAFALPALLAPRFVGARPSLDVASGVLVLTAAWSNVLDLYASIGWWDLAVHCALTGVLALLTWLLLTRVGVVPALGDPAERRRTAVVLVPMVALALSALWEMIEWVGYTFVTSDIYVTYTDTIGDMAAGLLGGACAGLLAATCRLARPRGEVSPAGRDG